MGCSSARPGGQQHVLSAVSLALPTVFSGPPDPLHGNSLYQKVRAAAQVSPGFRSVPGQRRTFVLLPPPGTLAPLLLRDQFPRAWSSENRGDGGTAARPHALSVLLLLV